MPLSVWCRLLEMCIILMWSGGVVYGWLFVFMSSSVMFVFDWMYSIKFVFLVSMAVSMFAVYVFVVLVWLLFALGFEMSSGDVFPPALFVFAFGLVVFLLFIFLLFVAICHSSLVSSSDEISEESEGGRGMLWASMYVCVSGCVVVFVVVGC